MTSVMTNNALVIPTQVYQQPKQLMIIIILIQMSLILLKYLLFKLLV